MLASIPSPSSGTIEIGPLPLHAYGLLLAVGVIVATRIAERRWVRRGQDREAFADLVVWVVISGVVGARVYHLFTGYDWDQDGLVGTVKIWEGGLSIWGVLGGGVLSLVVLARVKHLDLLVLTDCCAPGVLAAQAIGRWGNWFNQELYGRPTDLPWALEIDPAHRVAPYLDEATFHPTFLYESLYCALLLAAILFVDRRFRLRRGQMTALYFAGYTFGRFFFENLRVDPAEEILGLRVNAWVTLILFVASSAWFVWLARRGRPYPEPRSDAGSISEASRGRPFPERERRV